MKDYTEDTYNVDVNQGAIIVVLSDGWMRIFFEGFLMN